MTLLALRDVSKRYLDGIREKLVIEHVSLEVDAGEIVGVLASRRAGKTTLLRLAAGIELPDGGAVCWEGRDLACFSPRERARLLRRDGIALAHGDWNQRSATSVLAHVAMPLYSMGAVGEEAEDGALRALEAAGSQHLAHMRTSQLGMSERLHVELARALVHEPRLLLIDEPAVLSRVSEASALYTLLHSLPKRHGLALLIASEELTALRSCKRVLNLANGGLHSTDERRKVLAFPERRAVGESHGYNAL
jgi:putative ABC transport system ATP-binding protein